MLNMDSLVPSADGRLNPATAEGLPATGSSQEDFAAELRRSTLAAQAVNPSESMQLESGITMPKGVFNALGEQLFSDGSFRPPGP